MRQISYPPANGAHQGIIFSVNIDHCIFLGQLQAALLITPENGPLLKLSRGKPNLFTGISNGLRSCHSTVQLAVASLQKYF